MPRAAWLLVAAAPAVLAQDAWQAVRDAIDGYDLINHVMMTVGNESGVIFRHVKGDVTEDTPQEIWSSTKWIAGVAIMKEVQEGRIELDAPISRYLTYWTTRRRDSRSGITLRHLLGFASGYTDITQTNGYLLPLACSTSDIQRCAEAIYNNVGHSFAPGEVLDYNSIHLQIAGAVAERATGTPILELVRRNVFTPARMTSTRFGQRDSNPFLAGGIVSTPRDYFSFLGMVFRNELLSEATNSMMMSNPFPAARSHGIFLPLSARYGLANWFECPRVITLPPGVWNDVCVRADIHSSHGASGSYPIIDRRLNYFYHFAHDGIVGAGAGTSTTFRDVLKPLVDAAVTGAPPPPARVPPAVVECLRRAAAARAGARNVTALLSPAVPAC